MAGVLFPSVVFIRRPLRVNPTSSRGPGDDYLVAEKFDVKVHGQTYHIKRAPAEADAPTQMFAKAWSSLLLLDALLTGVIPHLAGFLAVLFIRDG